MAFIGTANAGISSVDLRITKSDGGATSWPGGIITYEVTYSNVGTVAATGVVVTETVPAHTSYNQTFSNVTWSCLPDNSAGSTCTYSHGSLPTVLPYSVTFGVTVDSSLTSNDGVGQISNTVTISDDGTNGADPTPGDNTASDTTPLQFLADLSITKTDGVTTATPGGVVTYTITASNSGPNDANGATVADTFPAIETCSWSCVGAGGGTCTAAGSGNINDSVNLPAGGSTIFTASCSISAAASGSLVNTATVTAPSGMTDENPGDNSATDSDTLAASADLSITKTDGVATATPGGSVTYTITASNAGPSDASGATVADTFPASETCIWTCVGAGGGTCAAAGSGNINDSVNLPAGGSTTYTASCSISAAATGTLSNTATVTAPGGVTDGNPANNSATDSDTLTASADLSITKTDGVTTATPGGSVTYTITASNAGPSDASGATVADTFPASETCTWTCVGAGGGTCTASGAGDISDSVNLPSGGSTTYTASCTISAAATGSLSNTATVSLLTPAAIVSMTDPNPANNSSTDTDTLVPNADLSITKTDGVTTARPGGSVTYTITVPNAGPSDASGATVADTFPASETCTWTCVGAGGGTCAAAGSGNINDSVNLPAGGSTTYTASCSISAAATGTLSNTATVAAPSGVTDPTPGNNSATDTTVLQGSALVTATKTVTGNFVVGGSVSYAIVLSNSGTAAAGDNPGDELTDLLPAGLALQSASATSGTVVANIGTSTVTWNGAVAAGGSVTITIIATILPSAAGTTLTNQAGFSYDADGNGSNEANGVTDDPGVAGQQGTGFAVAGLAQAPQVVPGLNPLGLAVLTGLLVVVAMLRRRQV